MQRVLRSPRDDQRVQALGSIEFIVLQRIDDVKTHQPKHNRRCQNQHLTDLTHYRAPRQMLHAGQLAFIHPRTGKRLSFTAPRPEDFLDALSALR